MFTTSLTIFTFVFFTAVFSGHTLSFLVVETYGDEATSILETAELWKKNISAFIGPQETCLHEARMAAAFNLPMISYVSVRGSFLSLFSFCCFIFVRLAVSLYIFSGASGPSNPLHSVRFRSYRILFSRSERANEHKPAEGPSTPVYTVRETYILPGQVQPQMQTNYFLCVIFFIKFIIANNYIISI